MQRDGRPNWFGHGSETTGCAWFGGPPSLRGEPPDHAATDHPSRNTPAEPPSALHAHPDEGAA